MRKSISTMVACVVLAASSAYANCIESPFSIALSGGLIGVLSDINMSYGVTITSPSTGSVVGENPIITPMNNDGLNGRGSASLGYTNIDMGVGVNLELAYNTFDIKGDGAMKTNTFAANMISLFLNFDYHTAATSGHPADSNVGFYASFGFGAIEFNDAKGAFAFDVSDGVAGNNEGTGKAAGTFSGYSGYTFGSNIKLGVEGVLSTNCVLGVNGVFGLTINDITLKAGTAALPNAPTTKKANNGAGTSVGFAQSVNVVMPAIYYGVAEIRVSYFMG